MQAGVRLFLSKYGPFDGLDDLRIVGTAAHDVAKAHLCIPEQADLERPVRGQPQSVAGAAEVVCHRRDEPDTPSESRNAIGFRRFGAAVRLPFERETGSNSLQHFRIRHEELIIPAISLEGHVFDERSEEHTSELQSRENLVCRLLLEK